MSKKIIVTTLTIISVSVCAEPFGLKMGEKLEDMPKHYEFVSTKTPLGAFVFMIKHPPTPNKYFHSYLLKITPKNGLCSVTATGNPTVNDRYGLILRNEFDELAEMLLEKYGTAEKEDDSFSINTFFKSEDWMKSLYYGYRIYYAKWDNVKSDKTIHNVFLSAGADSANSGSLVLSYELENFGACSAEIKTDFVKGL